MQKAIYFVSRLIAARGILELTDCKLNFQVSNLDNSFGIKNVSIDLDSVVELRIEGGDIHPRIILVCAEKEFEFVLSKSQELYDRLRCLCQSSLALELKSLCGREPRLCRCGKLVDPTFRFCPWCGTEGASS